MKKLMFILPIAATALLITLAPVMGAKVSNPANKHNLSGVAGLSSDEICQYCHTPHNAITAGAAATAPLWNRDLPTGDFGVSLIASSESRLCLSCHDGATNLDAFGGAAGTASSALDDKFAGTTALVGDLSNDHPVGISYAAATSAMHTTGVASPISSVDPGTLLREGNVECASCHNPHEDASGGAGYFLRMDNSGSFLCLTCHDK